MDSVHKSRLIHSLAILILIPILAFANQQSEEVNFLSDTNNSHFSVCDIYISDINRGVGIDVLDSCMAGGPGSTSCSISIWQVDCSVDCSGAYYACCGALGCFCLESENGGGGGDGPDEISA